MTEADLVIGTSAGATAAAQLGGETAAQLYADILAVTPAQLVGGGTPGGPIGDHLRRMGEIIAASADPVEMRRGMGPRTPSATGNTSMADTVATRTPTSPPSTRGVLVLSPLGGRTLHPLEWGMQLAAQVDELRAGGSRVETILPDGDSLAAFGDNMMDLSTRQPAARAGYEQGRALAGPLTEFWR